MKGYKAININLQGECVSITMNFQYFKQLPTEFPTQVFIPPQGWGPFCVFQDIYNFKAAFEIYNWAAGNIMLFECEYEPSMEKSIWYCINGGRRPEKLLEKQLKDLPPGTALSSALKLTKLLTNEELQNVRKQ
jgi:hypothetical protein